MQNMEDVNTHLKKDNDKGSALPSLKKMSANLSDKTIDEFYFSTKYKKQYSKIN